MTDDEVREYLMQLLMEFGPGWIEYTQFHSCKWFLALNKKKGYTVYPPLCQDTRMEGMTEENSMGDGIRLTKKALDFIAGGEDEQPLE